MNGWQFRLVGLIEASNRRRFEHAGLGSLRRLTDTSGCVHQLDHRTDQTYAISRPDGDGLQERAEGP